MDDPNPAATRYAIQIESAAAAVTPEPIASDGLMTVSLSGGGGMPALPPSPGAALAQAGTASGFDLSDLIKIALLVVVASWLGSALFRGER